MWRVAGSALVSHVYRGRDEIFRLFRLIRRLTGGTYRSRLLWALADDEHAVAVYRATGARDGRTLDIEQVLIITLRDGRSTKVLALPADPPAFEAFWA